MKRNLLLLAGAALIAVVLAGCPQEDEAPIVRQRAERYWNYLYRGRTREAYNMLDKKSRGTLTYGEYARKVGFGPSNLLEVQEYWKAYYPNTRIEAGNVSVQRKQAIVSLILTLPDPSWFQDEAYAEAKRLGLEGHEYALFMIRAQTEALNRGEIPLVRIQENTPLVKEDAEWHIVFREED
ncbi:MAG: hypothetical protein E3J71_02260 [Candidatus Stahlbacteria bacterium]|nr:MAG: hypothetical protein E3J71_02260 [Candidatus Stahlbacteria bacterium]